MSDHQTRRTMRVVACGAANVGKSALLRRAQDDTFDATGNRASATIGIDFIIHTVPVRYARDTVTLQIWDTAGQERFRTLVQSYFQSAHAILYVFDVSSRPSFERVRQWLADSGWCRDSISGRFQSKTYVHCSGYLVGNKCDLEHAVSTDEAREFAREHNLLYTETSALSGHNVHTLFAQMAEVFYEYGERYVAAGNTLDALYGGGPQPSPEATVVVEPKMSPRSLRERQSRSRRCCSWWRWPCFGAGAPVYQPFHFSEAE